jgi:hypothetical protein
VKHGRFGREPGRHRGRRCPVDDGGQRNHSFRNARTRRRPACADSSCG